jgi:hypothetical protein
MSKKLPKDCPSCGTKLKIAELYCENCETKITGNFKFPVLGCLSEQEQDFILDFVKSSGSLKDMARKMDLSYPTVRNMLDDLIEKIIKFEA